MPGKIFLVFVQMTMMLHKTFCFWNKKFYQHTQLFSPSSKYCNRTQDQVSDTAVCQLIDYCSHTNASNVHFLFPSFLMLTIASRKKIYYLQHLLYTPSLPGLVMMKWLKFKRMIFFERQDPFMDSSSLRKQNRKVKNKNTKPIQ